MKQVKLNEWIRLYQKHQVSLCLPEKWESINWRNVEREVFRLQKRIYKASRKVSRAIESRNNFDIKQTRRKLMNLQRLALSSRTVKLLAIREVTERNIGKYTSGIDREIIETAKEKRDLANSLKIREHKPQPVRRVYIPKQDGRKRSLGIPTIRDRVIQAIYKMVLEPEWEAKFSTSSYGFRPERSAHDAVKRIWLDLTRRAKRGEVAYLLEADLRSAFDNIDHEYILRRVGILFRPMIKAWLKAGILENNRYRRSQKGTPQGGVISPLIANIAFHFIDVFFGEVRWTDNSLRLPWIKKGILENTFMIRYADDFVVIGPSKQNLEYLKIRLGTAMKQTIGVEINEEKTKITYILPKLKDITKAEPSYFLGFRIGAVNPIYGSQKTPRNRPFILITPDEKRAREFYKEIRNFLKGNYNTPYPDLLGNLNKKIRGWGNYYRRFNAKVWFKKMDGLIGDALKWWLWRKIQSRTWRKWSDYIRMDQNRRILFGTKDVVLLLLMDAPINYKERVIIDEVPYSEDGGELDDMASWTIRRDTFSLKAQRKSRNAWERWVKYSAWSRKSNDAGMA